MESLKDYITKYLSNYSLNKQATIKSVLYTLDSENISASEYCKNVLGKDIMEVNPLLLIKDMVLNSPFGYSYREETISSEQKSKLKNKKIVLSKVKYDDEENAEDEIYNV